MAGCVLLHTAVKLALLTRRFSPLIGGAERMLGYLASALADQGADVTVLTSRLGVERLPKRELLPTGQGSVSIVRQSTVPTRFLGTLVYMNNLRRWLGRHPPDLAYVSMLKHDAYVALGVAKRRGFPVVLRPEGAGLTGDVAWQSWGRFGMRIAERCKEADALVCLSKPIRDELLRAGYATHLIHDVANGVPVPTRPWNRREGWHDAPKAVFVGRLAPEKGLHTLIRSWPIVRKEHPQARLVLVGDGPEHAAIKALLEQLSLNEAVELQGAMQDVQSCLRAADLFVLPSEEEGMSMALLEAMALGIPLVASSIAGNRRLVVDFKHGRLSRVNDSQALARAIIDQWANLDRAIHMGRAARALVEHNYSIASVAQKHMELFEELIVLKKY